MNIAAKYGKSYFMPPEVTYDWVKKDSIEKPPIWCSVDLRDGNQALIEPMGLEEKLEFFRMLVDIGFKEIEDRIPGSFGHGIQLHACVNRARHDPEGCDGAGFNPGKRTYYKEDI